MFYGKAVRYTENGQEFDAVVYQEHGLLATHLGAQGQPLVHLVFADPKKENLNLSDPRDKFIVRHDVAHASHEFSDEYKQAKHINRNSPEEEFEGGRWSEPGTSPLVIWEGVRTERKRKAEEAAKPVEEPKADDTSGTVQ